MNARVQGLIGLSIIGAALFGGALVWGQGSGGLFEPPPRPSPLNPGAEAATTRPTARGKLNEGFELTPTRVDATSRLTLGVPKPLADHRVTLEGLVTVPTGVDAVCVTEKLNAVSVEDATGAPLQTPTANPSGTPGSGGGGAQAHIRYGAVVEGKSKVQAPSLTLIASPYTIARMVLEGEAVIAEERKEVVLPGNVMSSPVETGIAGVTARITSMQISNTGIVRISTEYVRPEGKLTAIVDAMHAIDEKGEDIGGGRWNQGAETFGALGRFDFEFKIATGQKIASVKTVLVTKYRIVPLRFTLKEVFQR